VLSNSVALASIEQVMTADGGAVGEVAATAPGESILKTRCECGGGSHCVMPRVGL
jgi:hypothetical protein